MAFVRFHIPGVRLLATSLASLAAFSTAFSPGPNAPDAEAPIHNIHVTYAEIGVADRFVAARIKYFKHDLEDAIAILLKQPSVKLTPNPESDSLFVSYLDSSFVLVSAGERLKGRVVGSGEEKETEMWWYEVLYESSKPVESLEIENTQLLELFKDQKNIVKAEHLATGKRRSFYFARRVTSATFSWG